ncbi:hypothetical protein LTR84_007034 [Exophiala bonariae]|uniref:DNA polymerase delta subunit 3 n=1 Tax=Exophiala bonariae TaxID=1690606 RepID=A0AAV9MZH2_9EURO|nr:hypothetical protein LTR84_007034 [Exophiala bonariae]
MDEDFEKYLATEILSEQRTISYRNVARALKVHVNTGKCMLYEFHKIQNDKKTNSIYATYLISGVKKDQKLALQKNGTTNGHTHGYDEDEPIPSSPPPFTSSMLEPTQKSSQNTPADDEVRNSVRSVTLTREERLESVKEQYETITSIHIYSLSPARIEDLVTLTDIGRGLFTDSFSKEDPLLQNKTYGVIQNPSVRRRKGVRPVEPVEPPPKFQPVRDEPKKPNSFFPAKSTAKQSAPVVESKQEKEDTAASRPSSRDSTSTAGSAKPATLKRDSSDLFKAFAKQSQQKPKSTLSRKQDEDTKMSDAPTSDQDEGESEEEALFLDTGTHKAGTKKRSSDVRKERDDRAAKLRKMMDSDDENDSATEPSKQASSEAPIKASEKTNGDASDEEKEDVAWSESDTEKKAQNTSKPIPSEPSGPKRRRGKRKIMKKRTTKDEDGYLVTKEEAVWESFSEDEPEPKPAPTKPAFGKPQPTPSQGKAGAKAGAKKASGNIMSFFGKKA